VHGADRGEDMTVRATSRTEALPGRSENAQHNEPMTMLGLQSQPRCAASVHIGNHLGTAGSAGNKVTCRFAVRLSSLMAA